MNIAKWLIIIASATLYKFTVTHLEISFYNKFTSIYCKLTNITTQFYKQNNYFLLIRFIYERLPISITICELLHLIEFFLKIITEFTLLRYIRTIVRCFII